MYRIEVTKDYLGFAAAHFITFKGKCERLHGHNYQVWVELNGHLNDDGYVFDFVELKQIVAVQCKALDHRVLLQTENPQIEVTIEGAAVEARHGERRYSFPLDDVVLLPLTNTTAELLAAYLAQQIAAQLQTRSAANLQSLGVWVAEGPGQRAYAMVEL